MKEISWFKFLLLHLVIGLVSTHRTWLAPTERVIGMSNSDVYPHLWGYWRWQRQRQVGLLETWNNAEPYLNAPYTGDLYHVDWLNAAIVNCFQTLQVPFLLSINCMLAFQWILFGIGVIALAKHFKLRSWGIIFCILSVDTSLFVQRFVLQSGVFERMNLGTLCLYLLCLLKIPQSTKHHLWQWTLGGIVAFALTTLGSWHYAMFLLLASIFITTWWLFQKTNRIIIQRLALLALGCGIVAVPISRRARMSLSSDTIIEHKAHTVWDWHSPIEMLNDVQWIHFFWPHIKYTQGYDVLEESIFIGPLIPTLLLVALWIRRQHTIFLQATEWLLLLLFCLFGILTLGPHIYVTDSLSIASPLFYGLAGIIPYFLTLEVPWEYSIMAILFASLLIGSMHQMFSKPWIPSGLLLLQQSWALPDFIDTTIPTNPTADVLAVLALDDGNLLDYPFRNQRLETSTYVTSPHHRYLWWATQHERPIAHGIQQSWLHKNDMWREINKSGPNWRLIQQSCRTPICHHPQQIPKTLKEIGFSHFVVHTDLLSPDSLHSEQTEWTKIFGIPILQSEETIIYGIR